MGCMSSSTTRAQQQPTYQALLQEIFELVTREEQLMKFNKKSEIVKYYSEYDWNGIASQFKLQVKTLIDHIEAYKVRLNDTALYVENKIKLSTNPIILKMSVIILLELVSNLHKFIQMKEIQPNHNTEESKIEISQRSIQVQLVSDNFLKFELAFSTILAYLIKGKLQYSYIWWEYLLQSLELFSKKSSKQFQSENIQSILAFIEYIIGSKLKTKSDQFEWVFQNQEEQQSVTELLDSIKDVSQIMIVYKDAILMIPADRLLITKHQRQLFQILIQNYEEKSQIWHKLVEIFISRHFEQQPQQYEDLFTILYNNFDEDYWSDYQQIIHNTKLLQGVAKNLNLQSNIDIYLIQKIIEYIDSQTHGLETPNIQLQKKLSETNKYMANNNVKTQAIKLMMYLFDHLDSGSFILFQQNSIVKALLFNLKTNNTDDELFEESSQCLLQLLQIMAPDKSSYQSFILQVIVFIYQYHMNLLNGTAINSIFLEKLINMYFKMIKMSHIFEKYLYLTDEILYMLLEIGENQNNNCQFLNICSEIIIELFVVQHSQDQNESMYLPNENLLIISSYFTANFAMNDPKNQHKYFSTIISQTSESCIYSLILNFIDETYKQKKSTRKIDFDNYPNKVQKFTMILNLINNLPDDSAFSQPLYSILGPLFQQIKKKCKAADLESILLSKQINEYIQEIQNICATKQIIDFEKVQSQFKERVQNMYQQNGIVNLDDIQIKEENERGSMYQSFQAPSHIDVKLDESFEKQLQTVKKQKIKQEKLEHLTTEQKEMMEF